MKIHGSSSVVLTRYMGMISLTFFISHYLSYRKLPFSLNYEFPLRTFLVVLLFGIIICETNAFIYRYLKETLLYKQGLIKIIYKQFLYSGVVTAIIFSGLYLAINNALLGNHFHLSLLIEKLIIIIAVTWFEDVLLTFKDLQKIYLSRFTNEKTQESELSSIIAIDHGNKTLEFEADSLAYLCSVNGVVTLLDQNLREYTTQFGSLNELEGILSPRNFFRINRRYLINRNVIKSIKKGKNRKLKVLLEKPFQEKYITDELNVSRYKNLPFKKWYLSNVT